MKPRPACQSGLTLLEMMVSVAVFMVLAGAAFGLLIAAQHRQKTEGQLLDSFQAARLSLDDLVRDVSDAGYPPRSFFSATTPPVTAYAGTAFAWSPNYPGSPCTVNVSCITPASYDLIIETDIDPEKMNGVEWVRYQLNGTTLFRGVVSKASGVDPALATQGALVPYVENVVNNPSPSVLAQLQTQYPSMFSGGPVPVFSYAFPNGTPNLPANIQDVNITLIVMAQDPDPETRQLRVAELNGRARRLTPPQ